MFDEGHAMAIEACNRKDELIVSLRASLAAAEERAGMLETLIVDAHFRAFGQRRYAYVDPRSACDLLVADITTTQAERDAAIAQRDDLAATVAGLRGAIETLLDSAVPHPVEHPTMTAAWKVGEQALAASPAEHAGRIQAAALREAANLIRQTTPDGRSASNYDRGKFDGRVYAIEQLESEADRLEKAVVA